MTEEEWKLKKELAQTKIAFALSQSQLLQIHHDKAVAEDKALGDRWPDPNAPDEADNVEPIKQAS